ncbi:CLUMA_CG009406, isoform A [Clunio marinus]|uniref:CLUMA_CG009406, isoform A n=1 Tax=Clunio marinus TaxID=568069 RepID=A0A1J1I700_9DIPT|nr:CLUMA_CG009406, isoform A [Clunio marinus]
MLMLRLLLTALAIVIKINTVISLRNETVVDPSISWFLKYTPLVDLTDIPEINAQCRNDFQTFLIAMENLELWALKMHDATAKIPSGIFNGNMNQYGDYDQCLNTVSRSESFQGKYCIAYLQPRSKSGAMRDLLKLVQSHEFFKSNFNDCGHRTPRFSHINWAVCIPSSCSHEDLEHGIKAFLRKYSEKSDIIIDVKVKTNKNEWLIAFSVTKNIQDLLNVDDNPNEIQTVHGIRFLNAMVLMFTHKSMAILFNPFINRTEMTKRLANPFLLVYASAASLYTDIFLMLSGLLTTYTLIGRLQKGRKIVIWRELLDRYVRIVPSIIFLILFCTYILPLLGSGPMWNLVVTSHSDICKKHWWRNLLFVQNWFGYNSICLTNTHHTGIDMQLFIVAIFLTIGLWRWPKRGIQAIIGLSILSTIARFYVTITHELSIHIFFGISLSKIAEVADRMYIIPPFRFTVYSMGMLLGYILRRHKDSQMTPKQAKLGWTFGFLAFFITLFVSIRMNFPDYKYNSFEAALYAAFAPASWCVLSAWIIFASEKGCNNQIVQLFKMKIQRIFTKISYAIYLTQFPIFFYNVGKVRNAEYFEFIKLMYNVEEFSSIIICSLALHLFIEAPFNNVRKIIFDKKPIATKKID